MSERPARKLLIVGWDAADWKMIDALFVRGEMPNLRRLHDGGVYADLATLEPKLSPLLWSSIATGKTADKHGILHFIEPNPNGDGVRVSSSTSRKTKALWNMLTQSGMRTNVVSWYASHPAEPINGVCVTNLFQENAPSSMRESWPMLDGAVHPKSMAARVAGQRLHPSQISDAMLRSLAPKIAGVDRGDERLSALIRHLAQCQSLHRSAVTVLQDGGANWDCTMVFYDAIDTIGHHFMEFHPPRMAHVSQREFDLFHSVMAGVYRLHDAMLGELLKQTGPDTTVILLSDHGFYCDEMRPVAADLPTENRVAIEAAWHRPFGVLVASGPGIRRGERLHGASILDIAPTALALLGLPVGLDMDGRVLTEAFDHPLTVATVPSWDLQEGEAGMHPPEMRQDPFESHDALQQLIDLGYMQAMPEDTRAKVELTRRESQFNLAVVYMTTGRPGQAVPIFNELIQHHPEDPRFALSQARSLFMLMKLKESAAVLREFLQRHPGNMEARLMLAGTLGLIDEPSEALSHMDWIERDYDSSEGRRRELLLPLGDVCSALGKWDRAIHYYQKALANDEKNPQILHGLARALVALERFDDSIDYCLRALAIQHVFPEAHHLLGVALAWLEEYDHAIQSFKIALSLQPGLLDAHRYLNLIHRHLGNRDAAARHRTAVEKLLGDRAAGSVSQEFKPREAPMGPQQWARRMGLDEE